MTKFFLACVALSIASFASAAMPPVLNTDPSVLSMSPPIRESGPVTFWQSPWHNGATLDGTARVTTPLGWTLFAAPDAPDGPGSRSFGGVDLATGGLTHRDVQLSLPANAGWPIAVSYSSEPLSASGAGGVLGRGWFFDTMPVLVTGAPISQNSPPVMYLVYGADAFVAFRPVVEDNQTIWIGTNGAAGTLRGPSEPVSVGSTWKLDLPDGVRAEFFDQSVQQDGGSTRRLWRYSVGAAGGEATAYVGDPTNAVSALSSGFDSLGRLVAAFDSAGRRYDFVYSVPTASLPSGRLIRVDAVLPLGSQGGEKLIARVAYRYPGDANMPAPSSAGSTLSEIEVQTWGDGTTLSNVAPSSVDSARITKRLAYSDVPQTQVGGTPPAAQARLARVFGYEAVRRSMLPGAGGSSSTIDLWTASDASAHPYASVMATWSADSIDGHPVVKHMTVDGLGSMTTTPASGQWTFQFDSIPPTSPSDEWIRRAVVQAPERPVASVVTSGTTPALTEDAGRTWTIQYFGRLMQADTRVVSPVAPSSLGTGSGAGAWVNHVIRDSQGRVSRLLSPARVADFVFGAATASPRLIGATETTGDGGASTELQRVGGAGAAAGMVEHFIDERRAADIEDAFNGKQITYVYSDLTIPDRTRRVWVSATKRYTDRPEHAHVPSRELVETTDVAFWPNSVVPKLIRTTPPLVSTERLEENSPPIARRTWTLMDRLGQRIGIVSPKKVLEEWAFDRRTGLLLRHTADADPRTDTSIDAKFAPHNGELELQLLDGGAAWKVSGESDPYRVNTRYQYDLVGRVTFTAHPTGRISRTMRSVLPDGRLAVVDVPYLFPSSGSGPTDVLSLNRAEDDETGRSFESSLRPVDEMPGAVYGFVPGEVNNYLHAGTAEFVAIGHEGNVESRGTLALGDTPVTTPTQIQPPGSPSVKLVYGSSPGSGWFQTFVPNSGLQARMPIPSFLRSGVEAGELVERVFTPTGSREIERATYPLVNAQNFPGIVSGPGGVFGGTADSHYFLTSSRHDQVGRVMAVRDQTNTIDIVRYDVIGRPVAMQIGTNLPSLSSAFPSPPTPVFPGPSAGSPRLTRFVAYDQDSSGVSQFGNSLPTTVTALRSDSMSDSVQRRFVYDRHEQVTASIGLSDPAPHYAASYDRNGQTLSSAVFNGSGAAALSAALNSTAPLSPSTPSFGGTNGGKRQMLVDYKRDERSRLSETVRTPINEHTGAVAGGLFAIKETITYGATSKPVLVVGKGGTAEKTEYNRTCSVSAKFVTTSQSAAGAAYRTVTTRMSDATPAAPTPFVVLSQTTFANDPYGNRNVAVVSATVPAGDSSGSGALFEAGINGVRSGGTRAMFDNWRNPVRLEVYRPTYRDLFPELDVTTRHSKLPDIIWCNTMTTRGLIDADQNLVGGADTISVAVDGLSVPAVQNSSTSSEPLISAASGFSGLGMAIRSEQELSKFGLLDTQWQKESQDGKDELTSMKRGLNLIPKSMFIEIDCEAACEKRRKIIEEFSLGRLKKKTIMPFDGCPGAKQESFFGYPDSPFEGGPWFPDGWDPDADKHSNREVMVERPMGYAVPEGFVIDSDGNVVPSGGSNGSPPPGSTDGIYTQRDLFGNPKRIANPLFSTEPFNHIPPAQRHMLMGFKGETGMMMLLPEPNVRTAIPSGGTGPMHELKQFERHWGGGLNWGTSGKTSEFQLPNDFPGMPGDYNGVLPNATRFLRDGLGSLEGITNRRNADPSTLRGEAVWTENDLKFTTTNPGGGLPPSRPRISEVELPGGTKVNPQYGTTPGGWGNDSERRAMESGQPLNMAIRGFTDVNLDFLGIGGTGGAAAVRVRGLDMYDVLSPLGPTPMALRLVPTVNLSTGSAWMVGGARAYSWTGMLDGPRQGAIITDLPPMEQFTLRRDRGRVVAAQDFMATSRAMTEGWTAVLGSVKENETDPPVEAQTHGSDIINGYFACKDGLGGQMTGRYSNIDQAIASLDGIISRGAGVGGLDTAPQPGLTQTTQSAYSGITSISSAETIDPPFTLTCPPGGGPDSHDLGEWPEIGHPMIPDNPCAPRQDPNDPPGGGEDFYIYRSTTPPFATPPAPPNAPANWQFGVQGGGQNPSTNDAWTAATSPRRPEDGRPRPSAPAFADGGGFAAPIRADLSPAERSAFEGLGELASLDVLFSMVLAYPTTPLANALAGVRPGDRVEQTITDVRTNRRVLAIDHNNLSGNSESGLRIPRYDLAGNLTDDGKGRKYVYDAQARLVGVYAYALNQQSSSYGPGFWDAPKLSPVAIYEYDALGRLSRATFNTNGDNAIDALDWREEYGYDHLWRLAAIWRQGPVAAGQSNEEGNRPGRYLYQQYVQVMSGYGGWGADLHRGRLDSVVCRYRNTSGPNGKLDEIVYYVTNWRGDVTAIWEPAVEGVTKEKGDTASRAVIRERVRYSAWGVPTRIAAADINWDGVQDSFDETALFSAMNESAFGTSHVPRADLNNDGMVDMWDLIIFADTVEFDRSGRGELSATDLSGLSYGFSTGERYNLDNRIGFGGYMWDPWLGAYHVRHRVYDPNLRRWLQVDPIGYAGGDWDLSRYCNGDPVNFVDPMGLSIFGDVLGGIATVYGIAYDNTIGFVVGKVKSAFEVEVIPGGALDQATRGISANQQLVATFKDEPAVRDAALATAQRGQELRTGLGQAAELANQAIAHTVFNAPIGTLLGALDDAGRSGGIIQSLAKEEGVASKLSGGAGDAAKAAESCGGSKALSGIDKAKEIVKAVIEKKAGFTGKGEKIIVDENLPRTVADHLRSQGYDAIYAPDVVGSGAKDPLIRSLADAVDARVLTKDRGRQLGEGFGERAVNVPGKMNDPASMERLIPK